MSRFTGKCDFYDTVESIGGGFKKWFSWYKNGVEIEVDGKKFFVKSRDDVLPYYTRIIAIMCSSDKHAYIRLSSKPFTQEEIDDREEWIKRNEKAIKRWSKNPTDKNLRKIEYAKKDIEILKQGIELIRSWERDFDEYLLKNLGHDEEVPTWKKMQKT